MWGHQVAPMHHSFWYMLTWCFFSLWFSGILRSTILLSAILTTLVITVTAKLCWIPIHLPASPPMLKGFTENTPSGPSASGRSPGQLWLPSPHVSLHLQKMWNTSSLLTAYYLTLPIATITYISLCGPGHWPSLPEPQSSPWVVLIARVFTS